MYEHLRFIPQRERNKATSERMTFFWNRMEKLLDRFHQLLTNCPTSFSIVFRVKTGQLQLLRQLQAHPQNGLVMVCDVSCVFYGFLIVFSFFLSKLRRYAEGCWLYHRLRRVCVFCMCWTRRRRAFRWASANFCSRASSRRKYPKAKRKKCKSRRRNSAIINCGALLESKVTIEDVLYLYIACLWQENYLYFDLLNLWKHII